MLFRNEMVIAFRFGHLLGGPFELFGKGNIVEECPGVVELVIPRLFKLLHGGDELVKFFISDERE